MNNKTDGLTSNPYKSLTENLISPKLIYQTFLNIVDLLLSSDHEDSPFMQFLAHVFVWTFLIYVIVTLVLLTTCYERYLKRHKIKTIKGEKANFLDETEVMFRPRQAAYRSGSILQKQGNNNNKSTPNNNNEENVKNSTISVEKLPAKRLISDGILLKVRASQTEFDNVEILENVISDEYVSKVQRIDETNNANTNPKNKVYRKFSNLGNRLSSSTGQ